MSGQEQDDDVGAFLAVLAALLLDNVLRFEETVGRVSDLVIGSGRPDRELVVTLQSFDRLKQEFEALGEALSQYAQAMNASLSGRRERTQLEESVIGKITVADLKDRLLQRLENGLPRVTAPQLADAMAAEVDVDVVF